MGTLKNKIIASIAIGAMIITVFFTLSGLAGKLHAYSQNFNREHLKAEEFSSTAEFESAKEAFQKEADRVNPIANGMLIGAGASAVVTTVATVAGEVEKKKQAKKEELAEELGIENGFAGTL